MISEAKAASVLLFLFLLNINCSEHADTPHLGKTQPESTKDSIIRVGPNRDYTTPSSAAANASSGDVIEIEDGVYSKDAAVWTQDNLTIRGLGQPHIKADGAHVEGKGIWVFKGDNILVENIELSGARVPDGNGAAIRFEGTNLTLRNCYIHDNENGFLCGENVSSQILFEACEFSYNGAGDGFTHNMYIGAVGRFELRCSYVHHAKIGHNVKSRAANNYILYNRIMDEQEGNSSYAIDLPNGGLAFVLGNVLHQGPNTDNSTIVAYGAEGQTHSLNEIYIINNTMVNDMDAGLFVGVLSSPTVTWIINNIFNGPGALSAPNAVQNHNLSENAGFVNPQDFNYRLKSGSPAIDAGIELGEIRGVNLTPRYFYNHKSSCADRSIIRTLDIGAFEYMDVTSVDNGD